MSLKVLLDALHPAASHTIPTVLPQAFTEFTMFSGQKYIELLELSEVREFTSLARTAKTGYEMLHMRDAPEHFHGAALQQKITDNFTLVIRSLQKTAATPLRSICEKIAAQGWHSAGAALAVTQAKSGIAGWEPEGFVVAQVEGSATWRLAPPVVDVTCKEKLVQEFLSRDLGTQYSPLEAHQVESDSGAIEATLQPADGLFVPVGWSFKRTHKSGLDIHLMFGGTTETEAKINDSRKDL